MSIRAPEQIRDVGLDRRTVHLVEVAELGELVM